MLENRGFLGGSVVKNLRAIQETQVQVLGQEDPQEKGMTTHSSTLVWKIPWTEEPLSYSPWGYQKFRHDWVTNFSLFFQVHELENIHAFMHAKSLQLCLSLCDPVDCSPLSISVHGILQARILECDARLSSRGSFLTQGCNPHLLRSQHWQAVSLPLMPPGKP